MSDIPLVDLVRARRQQITEGSIGATGPTGPAGNVGATGEIGVSVIAANLTETGNVVFTLSDSNTLVTNSLTQGLLPLANLKIVVAESTSFTDFQSRVANIIL